jgi:hypothetical protein
MVVIHLCVKLGVFAVSMAIIFKIAAVAMETTKNTKNLKCSELDETFQKFFLTCVHIILRLTNFRSHFGFKMATIANRNGRNMVLHVLLPVNIHFH